MMVWSYSKTGTMRIWDLCFFESRILPAQAAGFSKSAAERDDDAGGKQQNSFLPQVGKYLSIFPTWGAKCK
jgi:hypothetical protein